MSWSEGRDPSKAVEPASRRIEKLGYVNGILEKLSSDDDLHDELRLDIVKVAIDHWTGKNRLPSDQSRVLQDNRSCIYVLQRLQMLRHACEMAGIASPLDQMLTRKRKLDIKYVIQYFGSDIFEAPSFPRALYADDLKALSNEHKPTSSNASSNKGKSEIAASTSTSSPEKKPATKIEAPNLEEEVDSAQHNSKYNNGQVREADVDTNKKPKTETTSIWTSVLLQALLMVIVAAGIIYYTKYNQFFA